MARRFLPVALLAISCATAGSYLHYDDVQFFQVEPAPGAQTAIVVSGMMAVAGLAVEDVETRVEGDALLLLVKTGIPDKKISSNLNRFVPIPDGVNKVLFGEERKLIWTRPAKE
jgi:hypothetical protein